MFRNFPAARRFRVTFLDVRPNRLFHTCRAGRACATCRRADLDTTTLGAYHRREIVQRSCVFDFCGSGLRSNFVHLGADEADARSLGAACEHLTFQTRDDSFDIVRLMGNLASIDFALHSFVHCMFQPLLWHRNSDWAAVIIGIKVVPSQLPEFRRLRGFNGACCFGHVLASSCTSKSRDARVCFSWSFWTLF